jgi:hypothetical protein
MPDLSPKQKAFLGAFAETGSVTAAARAADIYRSTHYYWLENPEYAKAFDQAQEEATDRLEEEARRRAVQGVQRLKFGGNGAPLKDPRTGEVYVEHVYSDSLLVALLRANRPEKYADRHKHEISNLSNDELIAKARAALIASGDGAAGVAGQPPTD